MGQTRNTVHRDVIWWKSFRALRARCLFVSLERCLRLVPLTINSIVSLQPAQRRTPPLTFCRTLCAAFSSYVPTDNRHTCTTVWRPNKPPSDLGFLWKKKSWFTYFPRPPQRRCTVTVRPLKGGTPILDRPSRARRKPSITDYTLWNDLWSRKSNVVAVVAAAVIVSVRRVPVPAERSAASEFVPIPKYRHPNRFPMFCAFCFCNIVVSHSTAS